MSDLSRNEALLDALLNGTEPPEITPQSRVEAYLYSLITSGDPPENPQSRVEAYLAALCEKGVGNSIEEIEATIELLLAEGDQTLTAPDGQAYKNVTIQKPETLVPENILKDVNIAGVVGNFEGGEDYSVGMIDGTLNEYITNKVTAVREWCFCNHSTLTNVSLPECSRIGRYAFRSCNRLTSVSFPACTYIGQAAFDECRSLTSANFPACTTIYASAFTYCSFLTSVDFPACTYIGPNAFYSCVALTSVNFPICRTIDGSAFYKCTSLTSVSFPACTSIGSTAFYNCTSLTSVSFPACTSIGGNAFLYCTSLTSVSFPACKSIGSSTFCNCASLTTLILGASNVCTLNNSNAFTSTPIASGTGYIYVPSSLTEAYKSATNWTYFSAQISAIEDMEA